MKVRGWLGLLLALALWRGLGYAAIILPWQGPDEPAHFEYVALLQARGRLVSAADVSVDLEQTIIASMDRFNYWRFGQTQFFPSKEGRLPKSFAEMWGYGLELHQPPLAYLAYLFPLRVALAFGADVTGQLYALRLLSMVWGMLTVGLTFLAARALFPNDRLVRLGAPLFVLFLPMHSFLTAMVNNDHLAEVALSFVFLLWVWIFRDGFRWWHAVLLITATVIGIFTKGTGWIALPICLVGGVLYLWIKPYRVSRVLKLGAGLGGVLLIFGMAGALFGARWLPQAAALQQRYFWIFSYSFDFLIQYPWLSGNALQRTAQSFWQMFQSFWGIFGQMDIPLSEAWYVGFALLTLGAVAGLGRGLVRVRGLPIARWRMATLILFALAVVMMLAFIEVTEVRRITLGWPSGVQGRFLFPLLVPLAILFTLGIRQWLPRAGRGALAIYAAGWVAFDAAAVLLYIMPFYYQP